MKPMDAYWNQLPPTNIEDGTSVGTPGVCPFCGGSGIVLNAAGEGEPCVCYLAKLGQKKAKGSCLAPALQEMGLENFSLTHYPAYLQTPKGTSYLELAVNAKAGVERFLDGERGQGLFFTGQVGCGKTHLAAACANGLMRQGVDTQFLVVPDFLDELRATYRQEGEFSETVLMERAKAVSVLILDDLGAHNFSDWTQNKLYSLVNHRVNHYLPMIITSNLSFTDLEEMIGSRTTSRLAAACKVYPLLVSKDIRLTKNR